MDKPGACAKLNGLHKFLLSFGLCFLFSIVLLQRYPGSFNVIDIVLVGSVIPKPEALDYFDLLLLLVYFH